LLQGQNKVLILLSEPLGKDDVISINIEKSGKYQEMDIHKKRNPYTLQFTVPGKHCVLPNLRVKHASGFEKQHKQKKNGLETNLLATIENPG